MTGKAKQDRVFFWLVIAVLVIGTLASYWPVHHFDFINIDDNTYVTEQPMVRHGLSWSGIWWSFHSTLGGNWNPLVWWTHMLDCQLYGLSAGGHHVTNLVFHTVDAILVFIVLRALTGQLWPSAFVAAIFAWHPLHIESVAWISERKDVLSAFFWWLAIWSYACYTTAIPRFRRWYYLLTLLLFFLGLMSKPMLVTLPFVFLLLDFWPLKRTWRVRELVTEKIPFFLLSLGASIVTTFAQRTTGVLNTDPFPLRFENALTSFAIYLGKFFWPANLAVFYPFPRFIPAWAWMGALLLLIVLSIAALINAQRHRSFFVGWFWFVGTLIPVIGLLQVGEQAMADRYTYIPSIGLSIALAWGARELLSFRPAAKLVIFTMGGAAVVGCIAITCVQIGFWQDTVSLLNHALAVTKDNGLANENLGVAAAERGDIDHAILYLREAIRISPTTGATYYNLGKALLIKHQYDDAIVALREAVRLGPNDPKALNNLAWVEATSPRSDLRNGTHAVELAQHACALTRNEGIEFLDTLAAAFAETGDFARAISVNNKILDLATADHEPALLKMAQERSALYHASQPVREE